MLHKKGTKKGANGEYNRAYGLLQQLKPLSQQLQNLKVEITHSGSLVIVWTDISKANVKLYDRTMSNKSISVLRNSHWHHMTHTVSILRKIEIKTECLPSRMTYVALMLHKR